MMSPEVSSMLDEKRFNQFSEPEQKIMEDTKTGKKIKQKQNKTKKCFE